MRRHWIAALIVIVGATACRKEEATNSEIVSAPVTATTSSAVSSTTSETATQPAEEVSEAETDPDVITAPPPMDSSAPSDTPRYALEDAAARGLIEYEVRGTGASSGEALMLTVRRLSDTSIDVYLVPGTVFVPGNSGAQSMVGWSVVRGAVMRDDSKQLTPDDVVDVTSMYLPDLDPHIYVVEAYCLDFDLDNPQQADTFKPRLAERAEAAQIATAVPASAAVAPDIRAAQIIREGKRDGFSFRAIQVALWADHNHKTQQEIEHKFPDATVEEMDQAFDKLLKTPPPKKKEPSADGR
jgi:hypothetical protein